MKRRDYSTLKARGPRYVGMGILVMTWVFHAYALHHYLKANPLPDGFQNEIFHLYNALELKIALEEHSWRIVHDLLFTQYWPPLQALVALPFVAVKLDRDHFVYSNLVFLALLMASTYGLGRRLGDFKVGIGAAVLVTFFPSIFGNLRHFEPNVPLTAMVGVGLWLLLASHRFSKPTTSLLFGLVSGLALMTDRLAGAFFLALPTLDALWTGWTSARTTAATRRRWMVNVLGALALVVLVSGYYYINFIRFHAGEISPQVVEGEILATGEHSEIRTPWSLRSLLFYPATLLDSQIGFALGILLLLAMAPVIWRPDRRQRILQGWIVGPLVLFTLIQKKQVYYTIPMLPAVAILSALGLSRRRRGGTVLALTAVIALAAVNQFQTLSRGRGLVPERIIVPLSSPLLIDLSLLGGRSPIPDSWVWPRYIQSRPPPEVDLKIDAILRAIETLRGRFPGFRVNVFSEDQTLFEGYMTFFIQCRFPDAIVNGLIQNPRGFYENLRLMDVLVYITPSKRLAPTQASIDAALRHRQTKAEADELPIMSVLRARMKTLELKETLLLSNGTSAHIYGLRPWNELNPR